MITNLTDTERDVWKDVYKLHEKYHDMDGSPDAWSAFATDVGLTSCRYDGADRRLISALLLALYDWFSAEQKIREEENRFRPAERQVQLEEIPWT